MVNWWFGARWFGFLGTPYERDCYLEVPLESQTTNPNHHVASPEPAIRADGTTPPKKGRSKAPASSAPPKGEPGKGGGKVGQQVVPAAPLPKAIDRAEARDAKASTSKVKLPIGSTSRPSQRSAEWLARKSTGEVRDVVLRHYLDYLCRAM